MALRLSWAASFRNRELELQFQKQQGEGSRMLDQLWGALCWGLIFLTCWRFRSTLPFASIVKTLALGLAYLTPSLWCARNPAGYSRHRLWVVTGLRLLSLLLPALDVRVGEVVPSEVPTSLLGWLAVMLFALKLPRLFLMALAFRLPFGLHLLIQGLQTAHLLHSLPTFCGLPFFQHASSQRAFAAAERLMGHVGALFSYAGVVLQPGYLGQSRQCSCLCVSSTFLLVFGFVVPGFVVACGELSRRAAFVAGQLEDGTWEQADLQTYLLHDQLHAWAIFLSLLPFILSATWHLVAWAILDSGFCRSAIS